MSLVDVDSWIIEYGACDRLSRDIQTQIVQRNQLGKLSDDYSKLSATIRIRLNQFSSELSQLANRLKNGQLTPEEEERRHRQVEGLQSTLIQLRSQFTNVDSNTSRSMLFQQTGASLWEDDDDDDEEDVPINRGDGNTSNYTVEDLRQHQVRILDDQNNGLEALSKIISRQKDLALQIGDEVDVQNDIIDDLADNIERTDMRINSETRNVRIVSRGESSTCGYWITIVILFIAILIVALVL